MIVIKNYKEKNKFTINNVNIESLKISNTRKKNLTLLLKMDMLLLLVNT